MALDSVKQWATAICLFSLAGAVIHFFVPKGSVSKALKISVAVAILCAFISPIVSFDGVARDFFEIIDGSGDSDYNEELAYKIASSLESNCEKVISDYLEQKGIIPQGIFFETQTDDYTSVKITKIEVVVNGVSESEKSKITREISEQFDCETVIKEDSYE